MRDRGSLATPSLLSVEDVRPDSLDGTGRERYRRTTVGKL